MADQSTKPQKTVNDLYHAMKETKLLSHQNVLGNLLFYMPGCGVEGSQYYYDEEFIDKIKAALADCYEHDHSVRAHNDSGSVFYNTLTTFYKSAVHTEEEVSVPSKTQSLFKQDKEKDYYEFHANKGNNNRYINHCPPQYWSDEFCLISDERYIRQHFLVPVGLLLQYLISLSAPKSLVRNTGRELMASTSVSSYVEYFSLTKECREKFISNLKKHGVLPNKHPYSSRLSMLNIAKIIYDLLKRMYDTSSSKRTEKSPEKTPVNVSRDIRSELDFFINNIDIYGQKSIDRLHALKMHADDNVYCANELGKIYYYGDIFYSVSDRVEIKKNYETSAKYYAMCMQDDHPLIPNPAWSFGYLVMSGKIRDFKHGDDPLSAAEYWFKEFPDYPPCQNSLATISKKRGDMLYLDEHRRGNKNIPSAALEYYSDFIEKAFKSSQGGWVYGYNNIASFLMKGEYRDIIRWIPAIGNLDITLPEMLKKSASLGNPWGQDQLANLYIRGEADDRTPEPLKAALKLLTAASGNGYAWAHYHLAIHFFRDDRDMFLHYMDMVLEIDEDEESDENVTSEVKDLACYQLAEFYYNEGSGKYTEYMAKALESKYPKVREAIKGLQDRIVHGR